MDFKKIKRFFIEYLHSIPVDVPLNDEELLKKYNKKKKLNKELLNKKNVK